MKTTTKNHVLTGGPGIGKTTIINLLAEAGFGIIPEVARLVIEEQQLIDGVLPWKDPAGFQKLVAEVQLALEAEAKPGGITFQDRSLIDGYGYCQHFGTTAPSVITEISHERYEKVFLLEPLPNYVQDETRMEDLEEAERIHLAVSVAYEHFGYDLIPVPVLPPNQRVEFILERLEQ